jgi:formyltetrahydrofolate-dependent phosphoribosylglycinamide formyltransferase
MQNLADVIGRGELDAELVCCVASNAACFGVERAKRLGIPAEVVSRKESASVEVFSERITGVLRRHQVDLALMAGFLSLWKIPADLQGRVLNIHPALLPKFGGKGMHGHFVHEAVLAAGEKESGCTVHLADNQYDHGPILVQRRVPVLAGDTAQELAKRVFAEECVAYPQAVRMMMGRRGTF